MGSSLRLGRIFGIPIEINVSWIFVFVLLTILLASQFDDPRLGWPAAQRWGVAVVTVVLFFLSVLTHELSHSVMALKRGIPVLGITLFVFGGVSRLAEEPNRPSTEFKVAVVGPLSSIALGLVLGGVWFALGRGDSTVSVVLVLLAWTNLSLGVFNLMPGFPLDGGRLLRAGLWRMTGSFERATQISSRAGQLVGVLMIAGGAVMAVFVDVFNGIWVAIVGSFLFSIASRSYPRPPVLRHDRAP